jgi:hypothetical protein
LLDAARTRVAGLHYQLLSHSALWAINYGYQSLTAKIANWLGVDYFGLCMTLVTFFYFAFVHDGSASLLVTFLAFAARAKPEL